LELIRDLCGRPSDAVRWACILEATSPKAGNVFPGREFEDLCYLDFVAAAESAAGAFDPASPSFSHGVLRACERTVERAGTNVNLGILLLLGPLVQADSIDPTRSPSRDEWQPRIREVFGAMTAGDASRLYAAINLSSPGGMGRSQQMDLSGPAPEDFLAAMRAAESRDRIAKNYANAFADLIGTVVPLVAGCIEAESDLLAGITSAQLRLLAEEPDTLICRKFGPEVARTVQHRADFDHRDAAKRATFDQFLRTGTAGESGETARLNPGTTADLIAAALYVLLRERDLTRAENQKPHLSNLS
jgi:triphosphoribosyl-dephospho-CoA synthase